MSPVAIFAATRWEVRALLRALPTTQMTRIGGIRCWSGTHGGIPYHIVQTGVGPEPAAKAARAITEARAPALMISTGFACALASARIGDLVVGTDVQSVAYQAGWKKNTATWVCDQRMRSRLFHAASGAGISALDGAVVSAPTVVCLAGEKRDLASMTQAVGLDMESAALAGVAARREIPFLIARTVSDLVDENLAVDFNLFLRPQGWARGVLMFVRRPSSILDLNRLRRQSHIAADRLTTVFQAFAADAFGLSES
ncbi:hypothetical protein [Nitrospira sp. KM1]|uniref:5'-methylthioadenosine/S-adenosylhomocysteine nucleosidase family protein n=1 Tax=Nitrospira sp. KM1 TaxID=1936990 RepID=UPI0015675323|nr:hypothetical protein [Nitrospira sp. KM1]